MLTLPDVAGVLVVMMPKISLIGPTGSGKTSVGSRLASLLEYEFCDTDQELEHRCGASVSWIYVTEQEEGFRRRESQVLEDLLQKSSLIISTGGGIVLREENRRRLQAETFVVYLQVSLPTQLQRVRRRAMQRALLGGKQEELSAKIIELNASRVPYYLEIADCVLETDERDYYQLARMIVDKL